MGLQHSPESFMQHQTAASHQLPFVPFHLQPTPSQLPPATNFHTGIKQEPVEDNEPPSSLLYRPAFQARSGSVSPRLESRGSSSSPSSYRSSPSPTSSSSSSSSSSWSEQSEPLDLSMGASKVKQQHQDINSMMLPPASTTAANNTMQNCNICNKEYNSAAALNMHMRTHTAGCKCPFCGKSFSRPWLLQGHIRTHTGEKPYSCNQCNKSFADKSNLRAHTQTHSDVKPFSCNRCGKKFALKSYLSKHEESSCLRITGKF